jgi:hypothetical protein
VLTDSDAARVGGEWPQLVVRGIIENLVCADLQSTYRRTALLIRVHERLHIATGHLERR